MSLLLELLVTVSITSVIVGAAVWFLPTLRRQFDNSFSDYHSLTAEIKRLETLLSHEKRERSEERANLYRQLVESNQRSNELAARVSELEKKEQDLQKIIADLRKEMAGTENRVVTVLGIWSGDDLDTLEERDAIYDAGFEYRALRGDAATRANILRELRQGHITILEIGAHGDGDAIFIEEQELTAGWWQRALKGRGVRVAVILACFSDTSVADAMRRAGVQHVIAVNGEIEDVAAVEFAQEFYKLFASGMPVPQAYDEARLALDYRQSERLVLRGN